MPVNCHNRPPGAMQPSTTVDLLTPPSLLVALGALRQTADGEYALGRDPFSLDPCASERMPWPTARTMWTKHDDGMAREWSEHGEIWLNSPYGRELYAWLARLAAHGNGVALLYARTDTQGFRAHVWDRADAVFFFTGRLCFHAPVTGESVYKNCGAPMVLCCYGAKSVERVKRLTRKGSTYPGRLVHLTRDKRAA